MNRRGALNQFLQFALLVAAVLPARPAGATGNPPPVPGVQTKTAHIVEWDLPAPADSSPGAMIVDTQGHDKNRLWFVTRLGLPSPRVIRLDPAKSLMKGNAQWKSWELSEDSLTTGGLRRLKASHDRRFVFVRTATSLQRIDTQDCSGGTCARLEWQDQVGSLNVSDMAIDDQNNVFTAGAGDDLVNPIPNPANSYIQKLSHAGSTATLRRWTVGGGAGFCADLGGPGGTQSFPCISGIAVHPSNRNLIYYSEPEGTDGFGNIGELNIYTNKVRRWRLSALGADENGPVKQPRQLHIDRKGKIWVITGSDHLVSLDTCDNRMTKHAIPEGALGDPFGLAPDDDVIGYSDTGRNTIGMLFPKKHTVCVTPSGPTPVPQECVTKPVVCERAKFAVGAVCPRGKVVEATITTKPDGDVFVEARIDTNANDPTMPNDSFSPLGITANRGKGQGTFFYAVGSNLSTTTDPNNNNAPVAVDRVGFVRLPMPKKVKHCRDDDDHEDGWDHNNHPNGWHTAGSNANDNDDDGLEDQHDLSAASENVEVGEDAPLAGGQSVEYPVTTSPTSLALIATATADDLLAQIGVEIYNGMGLLVAASAPAPGVAVATVPLPAVGTYRVKIRNYGVMGILHTPRLIVREPSLP